MKWYNKNYYRKKKRFQYYRKYARNHKKQRQLTTKRWMLNLKIAAIKYYSHEAMACHCCGEKHFEFLTINHIGGGGSQHRREIHGIYFYSWLKKNNYPPGYEVLCMNCNWALGKFGYCPHDPFRVAGIEYIRTDGFIMPRLVISR